MPAEGQREYVCYHCDESFFTGDMGKTIKCTRCGYSVQTYRARMAFLAGNSKMKELSEGPSTEVRMSEMNAGREFAEKLDINTNTGGPHYGSWTSVLYLNGDEREAVRLFIEINEENVRAALEAGETYNIFKHQWPDFLWQMLEEQWYLSEY